MRFREPTMDNINENLPRESGDDNKELNEANEFEGLENEVDIAIEEDGEYENKTDKRIKEWENKSDEEKVEVVKEKKIGLEKDLREDVKVPEDVMGEMGKLKDYQKELREKNREFIEEREDIMKKIQSQLDGGVDISNLDLGDRSEFKNVLSSFRNVTKNTLDIEKMDYYLEAGENELGDLLDTHEDREIAMESLEEIMGQIGKFEEYLKELESMTEKQLEIAKEEVRGLLDKLNDIYKKNPELFKKLLAAGVVIGVLILAAVVLGPGAAGAFEWASTVGLEGISTGISGATGATKALLGCIGKGGAMTTGAIVGGGLFLKALSWISDGKNRDDLAKKLCGTDLPWYAYLASGRPGEKK